MAVDKLVDSTQLDSDLTSVANAIRTRGGTSASLAFPNGFVSAVGAIGNQYTNADEGKVVSNGALVAQGSDTVTQNGTVDTTLINSLTVNVSGGGGGGNATFATGTFTPAANTTALSVDTGIDCDYFIFYTKTPSSAFGSGSRVVYGRVEDFKEGKRIMGVDSNAGGTSWTSVVTYGKADLTKSGTVVSGTVNRLVAGVTYTWLAFKVS